MLREAIFSAQLLRRLENFGLTILWPLFDRPADEFLVTDNSAAGLHELGRCCCNRFTRAMLPTKKSWEEIRSYKYANQSSKCKRHTPEALVGIGKSPDFLRFAALDSLPSRLAGEGEREN